MCYNLVMDSESFGAGGPEVKKQKDNPVTEGGGVEQNDSSVNNDAEMDRDSGAYGVETQNNFDGSMDSDLEQDLSVGVENDGVVSLDQSSDGDSIDSSDASAEVEKDSVVNSNQDADLDHSNSVLGAEVKDDSAIDDKVEPGAALSKDEINDAVVEIGSSDTGSETSGATMGDSDDGKVDSSKDSNGVTINNSDDNKINVANSHGEYDYVLETQLNSQPEIVKPQKSVLHWILIVVFLTIAFVTIGAGIYMLVGGNFPTTSEYDDDGDESSGNELELDYDVVEFDLATNNVHGLLGATQVEPTRYKIIKSYKDYQDCYDSIDTWYEDLMEQYREEKKTGLTELEDGTKYPIGSAVRYEDTLHDMVSTTQEGFDEGGYDEAFFDKNDLMLVEYYTNETALYNVNLENMTEKDGVLNIRISIGATGSVIGGEGMMYFITIPKSVGDNITSANLEIVYDDAGSIDVDEKKPVIYLYPTKETEVSVELLKSDAITVSYPKYRDGWRVVAQPNGDLKDLKTDKDLYSLYYEAKSVVDFGVEDEGFVVKGEDSAEFLEEKLATLGLNAREAEEFIIYWLPQLEANKYNYIRFATVAEIEKNMPMVVNPRPDTTIRVLMTFRGLDEPMEVAPQKLSTPERKGFVMVEWGGLEIL